MTSDPAARFELYKLYLSTAEKVSDRRAQANVWMLSVNSAIIGLYGYLGKDQSLADLAARELWRYVIPAAGIVLCLAWAAVLTSYSKLNGAKFKVLHDLEAQMPFAPFTRERQYYKQERRHPLSRVETRVPWILMAIYIALEFIALVSFLMG